MAEDLEIIPDPPRPVGNPVQAEDAYRNEDTKPAPVPSASTPGFFDSISEKISGELAPLQERRAASMDAVRDQTFKQADRDMAEARRAHAAISYSPNDMKPWNQAEQSRKFSTDPIQAFGSAGSVFAMIASAFTHAPMEHALNGAAAAMNAVRQGDEREYERAYTSWKDNTNLAIKRHQMEREKYQDAVQLMQTNMGLGRAKMEAVAASFNDQKMLFLARNGMDSEVFDLMKSRASSERTMVESKEQIEKHGFGWALLQNDPLFNITEDQEPDPFKRSAMKLHAYTRAFGVKPTSPEGIAIAAFSHDMMVKEHRDPTGEELAKLHERFFGYGARPKTPEQELMLDLNRKKDAGEISEEQWNTEMLKLLKTKKGGANEHPEVLRGRAIIADTERLMKSVEEGGEGLDYAAAHRKAEANNPKPAAPGSGVVTDERLRAKAIEKDMETLMKPKEEGGEGLDLAEAHRRAEARNPKGMTGGQIQKVEEKKKKIEGIVNQIDKVQQMIAEANKKGQYLVGIPGKFGTIWEFADRTTGKKTPHSEFTQLIRTIQSETLPILTGTTRLTKLGESARDEMIPGLGALRDATQVNNALSTLKKILRGDDLLAPDTPKPAGKNAAGKQPWERGVLVKPAAPATETAGSP